MARGIDADLAAKQQGGESICSYDDATIAQAQSLRDSCDGIITLIHQCRAFVSTIGELFCSGCGPGAAGKCTCLKCLCDPKAMNQEWLDAALDSSRPFVAS